MASVLIAVIVWYLAWQVFRKLYTPPTYEQPIRVRHLPRTPDFHYRSLDLILERLQQQEVQARVDTLAVMQVPEEDTAHEEDEPPTGEVYFKTDEPRTFAEYGGQAHIVRPLELAIRALPATKVVLDHKLLTGLPGLGKTLLAKITANELQQRSTVPILFVETYGLNLENAEAMDAVVASFRTAESVIWFIDEIHVLNRELATKLYPLMEENRYPFKGALNPEVLPPVMIIGATTDYGSLHAALKRRFGEPLSVRALNKDELLGMAHKLGYPIEQDAAELLVSRCWQSGAPFELKILFREARIFAQAAALPSITLEVVRDVLTTYEIDEHGLRYTDRAVITALFQRPRTRGKLKEFLCYGGSESDICAVSRLDKTEFQETIRPRLLSRGLLEVRSGVGLALTPRAVHLYAYLQPQPEPLHAEHD